MADNTTPNQQPSTGRSQLMVAVLEQRTELVRELVQRDGITSCVDSMGRNVIHYGSESSAEILEVTDHIGSCLNGSNQLSYAESNKLHTVAILFYRS